MGVYLNPDNGETKLNWLNRVGVLLDKPEMPSAKDYLVCLVRNGPFDAAGVCWCREEMLAFADPGDPRPKRWYWVDRGVSRTTMASDDVQWLNQMEKSP